MCLHRSRSPLRRLRILWEIHPQPVTEPDVRLSPFPSLPDPAAKKTNGFDSPTGLLPFQVGPPAKQNRSATFAPPALPGFIALTGRSPPSPPIGTLLLVVLPLGVLP